MTEAIKDLPALAPAAPTATGAASVTAPVSPVAGEIERAELVSELRNAMFHLSLPELKQVAHFIERLKTNRQRAA